MYRENSPTLFCRELYFRYLGMINSFCIICSNYFHCSSINNFSDALFLLQFHKTQPLLFDRKHKTKLPTKATVSFQGGPKQFLLPNLARIQWVQSDRCFDSGPKRFKEVFNKGPLVMMPHFQFFRFIANMFMKKNHVNYINSMLFQKNY